MKGSLKEKVGFKGRNEVAFILNPIETTIIYTYICVIYVLQGHALSVMFVGVVGLCSSRELV